MTYNAREVLADCSLAHSLLEEESDLPRWRVHWAAAVALVRAVGHVLDKVDGCDSTIKTVASEHFRRWKGKAPEHEIFREFIELERNNLLKEYRSSVHPLNTVQVAVQLVAQPVGGGSPIALGDVLELDENCYRPMLEGPWEGDDARDVLAEAIKWWSEQLDEIDREVRVRRGPLNPL
jgi:hypothetical protein